MVENMAENIFVDLQKVIDTANHNHLLSKLKHGIRDVANSWLES